MRSFTLDRGHDESGVSGVGVVLEGVEFSDGRCSGRWMTDTSSSVQWDSFEDFWAIHVASHPSNQSRVVFSDGTIMQQSEG